MTWTPLTSVKPKLFDISLYYMRKVWRSLYVIIGYEVIKIDIRMTVLTLLLFLPRRVSFCWSSVGGLMDMHMTKIDSFSQLKYVYIYLLTSTKL